ncbi:hypothetical protein EMIHUDRAFT_205801 [Emiliania huxleyi CCMP1516]|uniref:ABM domain-containing protein n=2 Tax=Emiliania huxleyi TaxID=2903 RepID=A0A0D3JQC9_EMIH1|nr:hypothetical protein EMIHUDRAFT_205801 [Emiliania huxleyi CCMP1516]EOD25714.1 hypothetical protein EMIHUDRAFT_205801 [Emiliania huxleyi CCMP1516]|eukprot:XP_005778143.1 hypothetical protein EMIHUDRAFT_205801 [Emiliania huxleyi CCMP1516]
MRVHTVLLVACSASSSRGLLCDCAAERACQNRDARLATISREIRQHASVDEWPLSRRLLSGENEAAALVQGHTYDGGDCYSFCCLKPSRRAPSSPASVIKALCRTFVFIAGVALFLGYCAILATGQPDSPALSAKAAAEETMRRRAVAEELLHAAAAREGVKPPQPFIVKVDSDSAPPPPRAFLWSLVWDAHAVECRPGAGLILRRWSTSTDRLTQPAGFFASSATLSRTADAGRAGTPISLANAVTNGMLPGSKFCLNVNQKKGTLSTEPLAVEYVWGEDVDQPNTFHFYEKYEGRRGFEAHQATPHFAAWEVFAASDPFTSPPVVEFYEEM